jgi:hypothetical protein
VGIDWAGRLYNLAISLDQTTLCLITLGKSDPDQTMSGAAWRAERDGRFFGFMRPVIDWLFSWYEKDHCRTSAENEGDA